MYVYLLMLACASSSVLQGASLITKSEMHYPEKKSYAIIYSQTKSPNLSVIATRTTKTGTTAHHYQTFLLEDGKVTESPLEEDGLRQFVLFATEYEAEQRALEKIRAQKTCTKKEERGEFTITTRYKEKKDGITRSAQRILMPSGRTIFGSSVRGAKSDLSSEELFEELAEIYRRENQPTS